VSGGPVTTYVGNAFYEQVVEGGTTKWKHYLAGPDGIFGVATRSSGATSTVYWLKDHLGSVTGEVDRASGTVQRLGFDAWGKRRLANGTDGTPANLGQLSGQRGFTGHEMLDEVGLVHMNGRIYDPIAGRFVSADPVIQSPYDLQNYNRYAYVLNNPLSLTDPSGFSFWTKYRTAVFAIVAAVVAQWAIPAIAANSALASAAAEGVGGFEAGMAATEAAAAVQPVAAIAGGFAAGGIQGGNIESAIYGALSAGAFYGAGSLAGALAGGSSTSAFANGGVGRAALHALAGCAQQAGAGGSCRAGALSAGFAEIAGPAIPGEGLAFGTAKSAILGGAGSVLGGGKFANGAVTGAFGYLFNRLLHSERMGPVISELESASPTAANILSSMRASPDTFYITDGPVPSDHGGGVTEVSRRAGGGLMTVMTVNLAADVTFTDTEGKPFRPSTSRILGHELGHGFGVVTATTFAGEREFNRAIAIENAIARELSPTAPFRNGASDHVYRGWLQIR
jgi:RHS repeat-associated protein